MRQHPEIGLQRREFTTRNRSSLLAVSRTTPGLRRSDPRLGDPPSPVQPRPPVPVGRASRDRRCGAGPGRVRPRPALRPAGAYAAGCPRPAGFVLGDDLCRPNLCAGGITESAKLRFASSRSRGFGLLETRLLKARSRGKDADPASDLNPGAPLCHEASGSKRIQHSVRCGSGQTRRPQDRAAHAKLVVTRQCINERKLSALMGAHRYPNIKNRTPTYQMNRRVEELKYHILHSN